MDRLWTPWRYDYVSSIGAAEEACILCQAIAGGPAEDEANLVLHRGRLNYVIINKYPYTNGHVMIAPYDHVADLCSSSGAQLDEMMRLARACERILAQAYHPHGFNVGMNIGKAAGAGVADHQHLHVVPRWLGDASFMSATAGTRVIPETSEATFARLRPEFDAHFSLRETEQD